jgi:serine/threonine protein kinase
MLSNVKRGLENDYDLLDTRIGDGNYGTINLAKKKHTDQIVAIKIISKESFQKQKSTSVETKDKVVAENVEKDVEDGEKKKRDKKKKINKVDDEKDQSNKKEKKEKKGKKDSEKKKKKKKKKKDTSLSLPSDAEEGLIREIKILKMCQHPHIVQYISCYEDDHNLYIVMEYVKHGDLLAIVNSLKNRRFDEKKSQMIIAQLISAVEYCHRNLIVHRDIKLENILVADEDKFTIKLADFGLSTYIHPSSYHMTWCGTMNYAPPEIIKNDAYDPMLVDIWSIGVVIYVINSGRFPWDGNTAIEYSQHIIKCIDEPSQFVINYPTWFSNDLKDLLTKIFKRPDDRITLMDIKKHPWINKHILPSHIKARQTITRIDTTIVNEIIALGFDESEVLLSLHRNNNNQIVALYHIIQERYGSVLDELNTSTKGLIKLSNKAGLTQSDTNIYSRLSCKSNSPRSQTPRNTPLARILDESPRKEASHTTKLSGVVAHKN